MNLLSLIIIVLALIIVGSICFIAWELTSQDIMPRSDSSEDAVTDDSGTQFEERKEPGNSKES